MLRNWVTIVDISICFIMQSKWFESTLGNLGLLVSRLSVDRHWIELFICWLKLRREEFNIRRENTTFWHRVKHTLFHHYISEKYSKFACKDIIRRLAWKFSEKQIKYFNGMNESEERKHKLPIRIKFTFAFSIGTLKLIFVFRIVRMKFHRMITELVSDPNFGSYTTPKSSEGNSGVIRFGVRDPLLLRLGSHQNNLERSIVGLTSVFPIQRLTNR